MRQQLSGQQGIVALVLLAMSGLVEAHTHTTGLLSMDFAAGVTHPLGGLDHVLAMVAVGLWATQLRHRALWQVPLTFVVMMAAGGFFGFLGLPLAGVETGIATSVMILGLLIALASRLPLIASMALVGIFAIFHGYAHGAEMAAGSSALWYSLGFMLATALLHGVGIGIGWATRTHGSRQWLRLGGAAISASGVMLLIN